jgi:cbb3-type cytochrome oxidase subunit 3
MSRGDWSDDLAGAAVFWLVAFPIMLVLWICRIYEERKAAEEAAEAARVYGLPDDFIHV